MSPRGDQVVVLCGTAPWAGRWRLGSHFLAEAMSRKVDVVYVDPPQAASPLAVARSVRRAALTEVAPGLAVLSPLVPRGKDRPVIGPMATALWRFQLRRAVGGLGRRPSAVITGQPKHDPFGMGERVRIFRVSDDFPASTALTGLPPGRIRRAEDRLAERADHVVCVSPPLAEKWSSRGHRVTLIPNGCDAARLRVARSLPPPPDITLARPVLGYVGLLSEQRIDFDLLHACLDEGWSLLMAGERRSDLSQSTLDGLLERGGVQWVGARPFPELVAYFGVMDVGLVPYARTPFNESSSPLKTLEYLAAGLPVVASDLPGIGALGIDHIRLADGPAGFVAAVRQALAEPQSRRGERMAAAEHHSWDRRAEQYLDLL